MKIPSLQQAQKMLETASAMNFGPWIAHSKTAGKCAYAIAEKCGDLDPEAAYIFGLLHDIGRREGVYNMLHIWHGYSYMKDLGYDDCARISITHSFPVIKDIRSFTGVNDCSDEIYEFIRNFLCSAEYSDYDKLIQLCDALAMPDGPCIIEKRLIDVAIRYGVVPLSVEKWKGYLSIRKYFEDKMNCNLYSLFDNLVL